MLVIRLARTGKKKQAYFRIVVADKRRAVGAKFVEILGNYNPHQKKFEINTEKLAEYLKNGAQPSNTLAKILKKEGIKMPAWVTIAERNRPAKKVEEPSTDAPSAEKSTEAPEVEEPAVAEEEKKETPAEEKVESTEENKEEPKAEEIKEEAKEEKTEEAAKE